MATTPIQHTLEDRSIGLSDKEAKRFSFCRLIDSIASPDDKTLREAAAFEHEVCSAAQLKGFGRRGLPIPTDVMMFPLRTRGADIISVKEGDGYTGTGGGLIESSIQWGSMVEILHNRSVMMQLANKLTDMVGNLSIPKEDGEPAAYWIGEDSEVPKSDADFGQIPITPKTVASRCRMTRKMLIQPSRSMEMWVRNRIMKKVALAIDLAAIAGTGENNQPLGILNTVGIPIQEFVDGNAPTFAELVAMETAVAVANADVGGLHYLGNPAFRGYAKTAKKFTGGSDSVVIWEPGNTVNAYSCEVTNQIPAGRIIFGNFEDLLVSLWNGMEILANRDVTTGSITVSIFQDADIAVLRAGSFVIGREE